MLLRVTYLPSKKKENIALSPLRTPQFSFLDRSNLSSINEKTRHYHHKIKIIYQNFFYAYRKFFRVETSENTLNSENLEFFYEVINNKNQCVCVQMTDDITALAPKVFASCATLYRIKLPDTCTHIGLEAFKDCTSLVKIEIPKNVIHVEKKAFQGCFSLKSAVMSSGVQIIGPSAFKNCTSLERVVLPNTITSIRYAAFENCLNLKRIVLSKNLKDIDVRAFYLCRFLEYIVIPASTKFIGCGAFKDCNSLKVVHIYDTVTRINLAAFDNCTSLKRIVGLENPNKKIFAKRTLFQFAFEKKHYLLLLYSLEEYSDKIKYTSLSEQVINSITEEIGVEINKNDLIDKAQVFKCLLMNQEILEVLLKSKDQFLMDLLFLIIKEVQYFQFLRQSCNIHNLFFNRTLEKLNAAQSLDHRELGQRFKHSELTSIHQLNKWILQGILNYLSLNDKSRLLMMRSCRPKRKKILSFKSSSAQNSSGKLFMAKESEKSILSTRANFDLMEKSKLKS